MSIPKRYFAEMSQSFVTSQESSQSGSFVSDGVTASFHQVLQSVRLNLTGVANRFILTPSGSGRAKITSVVAHANDSSNTSYSMSYGIIQDGFVNVLNGYFTGVIVGGGRFYSAALNTDPAATLIQAGAVPYLTSTNHTGTMAVTIFYKTEVI